MVTIPFVGIRKRKGGLGFTLMEVMVAVLLLGLATTMMMPVIALGLERMRDMKMRQTAVWLAEKEMEATRQQSFSNIATTIKQDAQISPFKKTVIVTDRSSTLKEVMVRIYWPDARKVGSERSISLDTLISKSGGS